MIILFSTDKNYFYREVSGSVGYLARIHIMKRTYVWSRTMQLMTMAAIVS